MTSAAAGLHTFVTLMATVAVAVLLGGVVSLATEDPTREHFVLLAGYLLVLVAGLGVTIVSILKLAATAVLREREAERAWSTGDAR